MIKPLPLSNKKILVPREKKQAKSFSQLIEKHGGIPVEIPLISFRPVIINEKIKNAVNSIADYDWIVFTSNVTVEAFLSYFPNGSSKALPKIAVIGERTEKFLKESGYSVDFLPSKYVSEVFADEFLSHIEDGNRVLIPKGNLAREYIADKLRDHGAKADEIVVYETFMPEDSKEKLVSLLEKAELDILMFTSPSTVDHFMKVVEEHNLHKQAYQCLISCIGPVTLKRLISLGFTVQASPEKYTVEEMVKSTVDYLEKQSV